MTVRAPRYGDLVLLPEAAFTDSVWQGLACQGRLWRAVAAAFKCRRIARRAEVRAFECLEKL